MNIDLLFPSFIAKEKIYSENILEQIYQIKSNDEDGIVVSNEGGWHSQDITHIFNDLFLQIETCCDALLQEFQIYEKSKVTSSWINCNQYKDFNRTHIHPKSFFSGVFYVQVPENSGSLVLENPNQLASNNFYGLNISSYNIINSMQYEIYPENNDLIIFNSHLPHFVKSNLSKEERISIAFNANIIK
jgi:uncharacterized protein (TIGR02466 family)